MPASWPDSSEEKILDYRKSSALRGSVTDTAPRMHEAPPSDIEASGIPSSAKSGGWQDLIDWDDLDLYALAHALKDVENIRGASTVGSGNAEGPQSGTLLGLERSKSSAIQHRWGKLGKLARIRARNAALVERLSSFKEYNLRLQRLSGVKSSNYSEIGPDGYPRIPSYLLSENLDKAVVYPDQVENPELVQMGQGVVRSKISVNFHRRKVVRGGVDWCWGVYAQPEGVRAALATDVGRHDPRWLATDRNFLESIIAKARQAELSVVAVAMRPIPLRNLLPVMHDRLEREMRSDTSSPHPICDGELEDLKEFIAALEPVDATMHEPVTQAELDEFAERLGYASCSDDDDESIQKKRLRQSPARRQRERAKRRSLRHERNLDPDNNSAPLALPGELDDPASTRLRRMYQAAGIPLRGGIDVRPVFDKHIETIEGEPYIKAGSHFIVSTLRDGSMTTEVTSPGTLKEREECVLHVNECRRLRRAFLRLLLGPKAVDPKGRASVGLGIALNARGVRFLPDVATLEPPAWAKPPASRIRVDLSPDSFYFAPDVQNSRWQMLLGAVGQHFT